MLAAWDVCQEAVESSLQDLWCCQPDCQPYWKTGRYEVVLRTIERNRIWSWPQAIESVMSIRISLEFAPKIVLDLILVLLFIQAIG